MLTDFPFITNGDHMLRVIALTTLLALSGCPAVEPAFAETCTASEYGIGDHTQGGPTASGEKFNTYNFTAAHKTRRLGSHVTVRNIKTGGQVVVRINDRGPFVRGRCIDLSHAAARAIGMDGLAQVEVMDGFVLNTGRLGTSERATVDVQ